MSKVVVKIIQYYQYFSKNMDGYNVAPFMFRSGCRYYPTCSDYAIEAIEKYGFWKGCFKGIIRVLQCNPLTPNHLKPKT